MDTRKKLIVMAVSLVLSLVIMTTATFAWFTLSTSPEVTGMTVSMYTAKGLLLSEDNSTYAQCISLSDAFQNLAPLHPVSTTDGIHWFLPTYNTDGSLRDASEFIMDNLDDRSVGLQHANVSLVDGNGNMLTGGALDQAKDFGAYVYADFWIKTDEENGANVRLSIPNEFVSANDYRNMEEWEKEQGTYGTYVLPQVLITGNAEEGYSLHSQSNRAETSIRVGFLVDPLNESADVEREFFIYEPNADIRSDGSLKQMFAENNIFVDENNGNTIKKMRYVLNYDFDIDRYLNNHYFVTNPIAYNESTGKGAVGTTNSDNLIVQKASSWDDTKAKAALSRGQNLNSNQVGTMGNFLEVDSRYTNPNGGSFATGGEATSIAGSCVILTLEKDTPVKVRLYIWLEGQDVDCWNDVSAGSFRVNLELAAEELPEQNPSDDQ